MAGPARVAVLADTGALYALIDASDAWHERVVDWWRRNTRPVLVPVTVLPEVAYLLATRIGSNAEEAFVRALADEFTVEPLETEDIARAADVMHRYADAPIDFVDASLVAMAERIGTRELLTSDRRHFGAIRPRHTTRFTLSP